MRARLGLFVVCHAVHNRQRNTPPGNDIILRALAIIMIVVARGPDKESRAYNGKDSRVEYVSLSSYSFPESFA